MKMGFGLAVRTCLMKYADFSGRATRPEFWYFVLFLVLLNFLVDVSNKWEDSFRLTIGLNFALGSSGSWPTNLCSALFTIPFLSAACRRFNDTGFYAGRVFACLFLVFAALAMGSKAASDDLPSWLVIATIALSAFVSICLLVLKSATSTEDKPIGLEPAP